LLTNDLRDLRIRETWILRHYRGLIMLAVQDKRYMKRISKDRNIGHKVLRKKDDYR
jgi:hypothetical protein